MKNDENKIDDEEIDPEERDQGLVPIENDPDFMQSFIEQKKLQNRILLKIIEKIKPTDKE